MYAEANSFCILGCTCAFNADLAGRRIVGKVVGGTLQPFESRRRIAAGTLAGRGLELVWLDSAVDAFFLHIHAGDRGDQER